MPVLQEGELKFTFPAGTTAIRFDGPSHGLSRCMKAVDFVVEFPKLHLYVEVKDPDDTAATPARRSSFASRLKLPEFTRSLSLKFRDSFLYRYAEQATTEPVHYIVLLQFSTLGAPQYLILNQALSRDIPTCSTPTSWTRPLAAGVAVLDMSQWNSLGIYGTVRRV